MVAAAKDKADEQQLLYDEDIYTIPPPENIQFLQATNMPLQPSSMKKSYQLVLCALCQFHAKNFHNQLDGATHPLPLVHHPTSTVTL